MCIILSISAQLIPVLGITSNDLVDTSLRNQEQGFGVLSFFMQFRGLQKHGVAFDKYTLYRIWLKSGVQDASGRATWGPKGALVPSPQKFCKN